MDEVNETTFAQEGYDLVGAAMEVYNEMGPGYLEEVYQECMEIELGLRGIPFVRQQPLELKFKAHTLDKKYRPDLPVFDGIIAELKAIRELTANDEAQLFSYIKGTELRVGYLLNFGHTTKLEWQRFIR